MICSVYNKSWRFGISRVLKKSWMDTKWEPIYVSNICVYATCTSYLLGNGILPQFVVNKIPVKCSEKAKRTNRVYQDNLRLFRCLAFHDIQDDNDVSRFDDATLAKYLQFHDFFHGWKQVSHAHRSHGISRPQIETTARTVECSVFDELEKFGIVVAEQDHLFPW